MTEYAFELKDARLTNVHNPKGSDWTYHSAPAYFDFALNSVHVVKGQVNIEFHARGLGSALPSLRFDMGEGFDSEPENILQKAGIARYKFRTKLTESPQAIRLSMPNSNGEFNATHLHIHAINVLELPGIAAKKITRKFQPVKRTPAVKLAAVAPKPIKVPEAKPLPAIQKPTSLKYRSRYEKILATSLGHPKNERISLLGVLKHRPDFTILIPVYNSDPKLLEITLESLEKQTYRNFDVIICDDGSTNDIFKSQYAKLGKELGPRAKIDSATPIAGVIFLISRDDSGGEALALNTALASIRTSETLVVDPGTIIAPEALSEIVLAQSYNGSCRIFYTETSHSHNLDQATQDIQPSFSVLNLCSTEFLSSGVIYKTSDLRKVGGWKIKRTGVHRLDLSLRLYEELGKDAFQRIGQSLMTLPKKLKSRSGPKLRVVRELLLRQSSLSNPINSLRAGLSKVHPDVLHLSTDTLTAKDGKVAIIVDLMDIEPRAQSLNPLLDVVFSEDMSPHLEVVVVCDKNSAASPYVKRLLELELVSLHVRSDTEDRNAPLQRAIEASSSLVIGLIKGDSIVNGTDWFSLMVSWALNPLVGACYASSVGYLGVASDGSLRATPVVDTRFMFITRERLDAIGGFDPNQVEEMIDLDLGLRLWRSGYQGINVPDVVLTHLGEERPIPITSPSVSQIEEMQNLWGSDLAQHSQYFSHFLPETT